MSYIISKAKTQNISCLWRQARDGLWEMGATGKTYKISDMLAPVWHLDGKCSTVSSSEVGFFFFFLLFLSFLIQMTQAKYIRHTVCKYRKVTGEMSKWKIYSRVNEKYLKSNYLRI